MPIHILILGRKGAAHVIQSPTCRTRRIHDLPDQWFAKAHLELVEVLLQVHQFTGYGRVGYPLKG